MVSAEPLTRRGGGVLLGAAALAVLILALPWAGAALRMTGDVWQDQAEVPMFVFWYAGAFLLGLLLGQHDPWVGLLVAYVAALGLYWPTLIGIAMVQWVMGAGILLAVVWWVTAAGGGRWIVALLLVAGTAQALYAVLQVFGYDPAWWGWRWRADMRVMGSIRSPNFLGAFLAPLVPLAPRWLLPVLLGGVALSGSFLAALATLMGLIVRYRVDLRRVWWWPAVAGAALGLAAAVHHGPAESLVRRLRIWTLGLQDLAGSPLFGWGLDGWADRASARWIEAYGRTRHDLPLHAHNEVVQWLHAGGLVAALILVIGIVQHRALWRHPVAGGALVAGAIVSLGTFPLHLASTALVLVVVYGLATAEPAGSHPTPRRAPGPLSRAGKGRMF